MTSDIVAEIEELYSSGGDEPYGEAVSMREHMLLTVRKGGWGAHCT